MLRFVLVLCLIAWVSSPLFAQKMEDVIYLRNGEIVRGDIIEQIPGESLKIQTADGTVFVYTIYEIAEIGREPMMKIEEGYIKAKKKNPWLAFSLSLLIPGTGQFYNDQYKKGLPQLGIALAGAGLVFEGLRDNYQRYPDKKWVDADGDDRIIFFGAPLWLGGLLWSVIDASISANRINQQGQQPDYGHLLEFDGDQATLGVDPIIRRNESGVRLLLHF